MPRTAALRFLQLSARLLLEYNLSSEPVKRLLERVAKHLDVGVLVIVAYREVTLLADDGRDFHAYAPELRINTAASVEVLRVLDDLCADRIGLDEARQRLDAVKELRPLYGPWALAGIFGLGASSLAWLLGADWGAIVVGGVSSGLGVIARQEIAKRHVALFVQPFTAGLIGAILGGMVIRLGWTGTPGLCLIVPALMLVPGPHLINGVDDILENHIQPGICRLGLALTILMAAAVGVVLGDWLALGLAPVAATSNATPPALVLDIALAGVAACGFGAFYNAPWRVLWVSILCGIAGHAARYLCLEQGVSLEIATFVGCLVVGTIASTAAHCLQLPFSAVAFAGAVPMMPGVFIYQSIAGAIRLSGAGTSADSVLAAATLALSFKAALVVGSIAAGLLIGARVRSLAYGRVTTA